ncbi:phage holin family protein [Alkalibacter rhizosphaerae]|uniref:Phage holin family protein n=2 Tax=Alkalibacter rhizosphaerae TaxID=2815577 RepID=A0A975AJ12_9FIRM|nr:phage holin family protein [Alkalibacter rhizosphaerae]
MKPVENAFMVGSMAAIVQLFGGWDALMNGLLVFISVDYLTGLMAAIVQKKLSSKTGFAGLLKKIVILMLVLIAAQVDRISGNGEPYFRMATALFYIANEGISILENAALMGLPIPKVLRNILVGMQEAGAVERSQQNNGQ